MTDFEQLTIRQQRLLLGSVRKDLAIRAGVVGFKPVMPRLPRVIPEVGYKHTSLVGYYKRMTNWISELEKAEYSSECQLKHIAKQL